MVAEVRCKASFEPDEDMELAFARFLSSFERSAVCESATDERVELFR